MPARQPGDEVCQIQRRFALDLAQPVLMVVHDELRLGRLGRHRLRLDIRIRLVTFLQPRQIFHIVTVGGIVRDAGTIFGADHGGVGCGELIVSHVRASRRT